MKKILLTATLVAAMCLGTTSMYASIPGTNDAKTEQSTPAKKETKDCKKDCCKSACKKDNQKECCKKSTCPQNAKQDCCKKSSNCNKK